MEARRRVWPRRGLYLARGFPSTAPDGGEVSHFLRVAPLTHPHSSRELRPGPPARAPAFGERGGVDTGRPRKTPVPSKNPPTTLSFIDSGRAPSPGPCFAHPNADSALEAGLPPSRSTSSLSPADLAAHCEERDHVTKDGRFDWSNDYVASSALSAWWGNAVSEEVCASRYYVFTLRWTADGATSYFSRSSAVSFYHLAKRRCKPERRSRDGHAVSGRLG